MKSNNPYLKQIITEISKKALTGRLDENLKPVKSLYEVEDDAEEASKDSDADVGADRDDDQEKSMDTDAASNKKNTKEAPKKDKTTKKDSKLEKDNSEEEVEAEKEKATKAKAELEKAKAEKQAAEKEIEKQSYVRLNTSSGVRYMISKIIAPAFEGNTVDSLANDMIEKLNITDEERFKKFSSDVAQYTNIPGMVNLLSSMKNIVNSKK